MDTSHITGNRQQKTIKVPFNETSVIVDNLDSKTTCRFQIRLLTTAVGMDRYVLYAGDYSDPLTWTTF